VSLVSAFGSIRAAVNAQPEEIAIIGGWGEKKVKRWCGVVDEPFRVRKAGKRGLTRKETTQDGEQETSVLDRALPLSRVPLRDMPSRVEQSRQTLEQEKSAEPVGQFHMWDPEDEEEALIAAAAEEEERLAREKRREMSRKEDELSGGIAAALAKLRDTH
jgi:DNA excision repair protein ERCC-1